MIAYAATSFLVSLYGSDPHTAAAIAEVRRNKPVFVVTPLTELEFTNALELRVFHREFSAREARAVLGEFMQDLRGGVIRIEGLPTELFVLARRLSRAHTVKAGTRSLDILHVASAVLLRPDVFYSFDERQRRLAAAAGLVVRPSHFLLDKPLDQR